MKDLSSNIVPHLWFVSNAREAVRFYISLFMDSKIVSETMNSGTPSGDTDIITFELHGQRFMAINGGEEQACGWLKDRFGIAWQIVPEIMDEMMATNDRVKLSRVTEAMLRMVKLNIQQLVDAGNDLPSK